MVSNSSSNTCSNCNWRQSVSRATNSWLLSCKSLRRKGKKLRKPIGPLCRVLWRRQDWLKVERLLFQKSCRVCLAFIFILPSPMFLSPFGKTVNMAWKYYSGNRVLAHTDTWIKKLLLSYIFNFPISKSIVLSFSCYKEDQGNNIQSSNNTERKREGLVWKIKSTRASVYQRPSQGHFLLGGLRAPFLLMEGKQNRWDTNCTFIHLKVQGNFPSAPVKFSDCLSILWAFHSSKGFGFVQCPDSYTHTHTH